MTTGFPQALIFDVDGTLAETEELHRRAFNETFAAEGLDWHWDRGLYRELLKTTGGKERMRAYIRDHDPANRPDDADIPAIHQRKTARYGALMAAGEIALRPGIADLISDAARNGVRVAVATTTNLPNVDALVRACWGKDAAEVFEVIAAGDMVDAKKPAPDVFLLALQRLGLVAADCIAFEDSRNGLLSATGAGIPTLVSPGSYTDDHDFAECSAQVASFSQVSTIADLRDVMRKAA